MIKVLVKAFKILEAVERQQPLELKEIAARTGINKTTISNIVKTLMELGYLLKDGQGRYIPARESNLTGLNRIWKNALLKAAVEITASFSGKTGQTCLAAVMEGMERHVITTARPGTEQLVDGRTYRSPYVYGKASGRLLLAYQKPEDLRRFVIEYGFPKEGEWAEVGTYASLEQELEKIKKAGEALVVTPEDRELMALPVYGPDGNVWAALATTWYRKDLPGGKRRKMLGAFATHVKKMAMLIKKYTSMSSRLDDEE